MALFASKDRHTVKRGLFCKLLGGCGQFLGHTPGRSARWPSVPRWIIRCSCPYCPVLGNQFFLRFGITMVSGTELMSSLQKHHNVALGLTWVHYLMCSNYAKSPGFRVPEHWFPLFRNSSFLSAEYSPRPSWCRPPCIPQSVDWLIGPSTFTISNWCIVVCKWWFFICLIWKYSNFPLCPCDFQWFRYHSFIPAFLVFLACFFSHS